MINYPDNKGIHNIDFNINLLRTVLWQWENDDAAVSLAQYDQKYADDYTQFWIDFYHNIFDIRTANQFGLIIWARILGLPLTLKNEAAGDVWGFGTDDENFDNAPFITETGTSVTYGTARILLLLRRYSLELSPTIPNINFIIKEVFGQDAGYVVDRPSGIPMTMHYHFSISLPLELEDAFNTMDILPRPAGVLLTWGTVPRDHFGFETNHDSFNINSYFR